MSTLTAGMNVYNLQASVLGGQKVSHSLEMKLQMVLATTIKHCYCTIFLDLINLFILLHI